MSNLNLMELLAAACGLIIAGILFLTRRFGPATWLLSLYLVPASLAPASLALAPILFGFNQDESARLAMAFFLLAAPGGIMASCTIERQDWRAALARRRRSTFLFGAAAPILAILIFSPASRPNAILEIAEGEIFLGYPGYAAALYLMMASIIAISNIEQILRSAQELVRWEIKFLLLGLATCFGAVIYISSNVLLYIPSQALLSRVSLQLFPMLFPISCAFILISWRRSAGRGSVVVVSHGLVYSSITLLTAGIYLLVSGLVARWAARGPTTGIPIGATIFILSLVALAVVLLWTDFRHRAKLWIRRNLLAGSYDYRQYWLEASERIQLIRQMDAAADALAEIVQRSVGSIDVSVWMRLRNPNRFKLVAKRGGIPYGIGIEVPGVAEKMLSLLDPFGIGELDAALKADSDFMSFWESTRTALMIPLQSSGRLVGVLTAGADRSGKPFHWDTREFLKVLGNHAAAEFHKADLLSTLVNAKEDEAFRTFSLFLLHDLKNFASTLSLISRNAQKHHGNPDFQRDAFGSIFEISEKIKRLCNNLRIFSSAPAPNKRTGDLNELVRQVADNFSAELGGRLRLELAELPHVILDPEEITRVIQNLVLNAREAIAPDGLITIRTHMTDGKFNLAVSDNGKGIKKEFLDKDLFLPFRTTKSDGLGIGLFQCRRVIEAHKGAIRVESEEGKGTTVSFWLPAEISAKASV